MKYKHHKRIKLIYNPAAGSNKKKPLQFTEIIKELQYWRFIAEPFITEPDTDYYALVADAIKDGIRMFVVCGGDGTVSATAAALLGTRAILGIIPSGTRNNIALSLGIPNDLKVAIELLRRGRKIKTDMGIVKCANSLVPFLEVCSIGLFSELFQSSDSIQHGDISQIKDFISKLSSSFPSKIHLILDNKTDIKESGHVVIVSNMPFVGHNYKIGNSEKAFSDGFFDVLICADIPKIRLMLGYVLKTEAGGDRDYRIKRFRAKNIVIKTDPPMSVLIDGRIIKHNSVIIDISHNALNVMAGVDKTRHGNQVKLYGNRTKKYG